MPFQISVSNPVPLSQEVQTISKEALDNIIGNSPYQHVTTNHWSQQAVETITTNLVKLNKPYKFIGENAVRRYFLSLHSSRLLVKGYSIADNHLMSTLSDIENGKLLNAMIFCHLPVFFPVTCVIMQTNTGAGLSVSSTCYWDKTTDMSFTVRWENKAVVTIVNVFAVAI
ncbi:unnamed protein product [Thelazia callipaeda]|uniref:Tctex-1 family protein n=1 Tax=Thelazia callipaeda TaxID=103827 RepID=A0A0N5D632_THECL|nr:unnamed protein product [Thelazia callipaeda]